MSDVPECYRAGDGQGRGSTHSVGYGQRLVGGQLHPVVSRLYSVRVKPVRERHSAAVPGVRGSHCKHPCIVDTLRKHQEPRCPRFFRVRRAGGRGRAGHRGSEFECAKATRQTPQIILLGWGGGGCGARYHDPHLKQLSFSKIHLEEELRRFSAPDRSHKFESISSMLIGRHSAHTHRLDPVRGGSGVGVWRWP